MPVIVHRKVVDGKLVEFTVNGFNASPDLPDKPGLLDKASNLVMATGRATKALAAGKQIMASQDEVARRLSICRCCEFFKESPAMRCLKCGCFLNLKTRLETEHCPIRKW
jgi:hypothetical protein